MDPDKAKFLNGGSYVRVEDLPWNSCCLTIPKPTAESIENIRFYIEYSVRCHGFDCFSIPCCIDNLLVKWLKIKKYIQVPEDRKILAILFVQPFWINHSMSIAVNQTFQRVEDLFKPPGGKKKSRNGQLHCCTNDSSDLVLDIDYRMPFAFVLVNSSILRSFGVNDIITFMADVDVSLYCKTRPTKLIPTNNPLIALLIFSDILQDEKDCAKLMRKYLKNPTHPAWTISMEDFWVKNIYKRHIEHLYFRLPQRLNNNGNIIFDLPPDVDIDSEDFIWQTHLNSQTLFCHST